MDTDHEAMLTALQEEFPAFRITRELTLTGPRYIARSRHLSQNPHTLITADPGELRTALTSAPAPQGPPVPQPRPAAATLPRRRPA
jgi:hypothetical protein